MDWSALKAEARKAVHDAFAVSVQYTPPGVPPQAAVPLTVRLHANIETFGDLDREGYARMVEETNRIVFMSDQSPLPLKGGFVTFEDGTVFQVKSVWPTDGPLEIPCEVVRK